MIINYEKVDYMFPEEELREFFPSQEYDNFLYHYTNLDAAESILAGGDIWLSDINSLNDTSEAELLYEKLKKFSSNDKVRNNIVEVHSLLTKNTYIGSFSGYGNLLTLWRGYGKIAIGFDYWKLQSGSFIEDKNGKSLVTSALNITSCRYLDKLQIEKRAKELIERYEKSAAQDVRQLLTLGVFYFDVKHPAFLDEREARIVHYLHDRQPFTNARGVKYIKYKFNKQAIKRIVFGPSASEDIIDEVSQQISTDNDLKHIMIYKSTIPFTGK